MNVLKYVALPLSAGVDEDAHMVYAADNLAVADCLSDDGNGEREAVLALLFAAAPDLLAACEELLLSFGTTEWESVHDAARVEFARQAVAKAKGGAA